MPDISQLTGELRGLPDQALQQELQQPTGMVPSYLVLAEAQRRATMRQAAQQQQAKGDSSTVLQDVVRNMMSQQPAPGIAPAGMTPGRNAQTPTPGGMPTPTPPQPPQKPPGMRRGGPLRFDEGGINDDDGADDNIEGGDATLPSALQPRLLTADPITQQTVNRYTPTKFRPSPRDVDGWIEKYSAQFGVDPDMARAMMGQESGGQQGVTSPKGAHGLFQLMPGTAQEMGVDPRVPEQNVRGGIGYFAKQLKAFDGDPVKALAAYNAGAGAVTHYGGVPPFPETQAYVPAIMARYNRLKQARGQTDQQQPGPQAADAGAPPNPAFPAPDPNEPPEALPGFAAPATPEALLPQAGEEGGGDDQQPVFKTNAKSGRIHQAIADLETQKDQLQGQLDRLQDPFRSDNMSAVRQNILTAYGLPQNYLESLGGDARKATIRQLQEEASMRFHNPSPWEFLANVAAGMGQSRNLTFAGAFGEGVGHAWQVRDAQQQAAFQDWNALQQDADKIDANAETARGRFDTLLNNVLTHQATISEAQRKQLQDQLMKNTAEQDKFKKMLVPTNKFDAFFNQEDHTPEEIGVAAKAWGQQHGMTGARLTAEANAVQKLAALGDPFVPDGPYATAYDQIVKKHPDQAASLLIKPEAPVGELNPNLLQNTYLTNRKFVDGRNMHGKYADQVQQQVANMPGVTFLGKDQAESLDNIEDSQRGFDSMEKSMLNNLPRDSMGHVITANLKQPMNKLAQFDPTLASWGAWRANAIAQLRAAAGSKGLRINQAEILSAVENDIPLPSDTVGTAMRKLAIMRRTIQNQEDSLFHTRKKEAPAADIPMLGSDKKTMYYVPAAQWKKYVDQGYTMLE